MNLSPREFSRKLALAKAAALSVDFGAELLCRRNPQQLAAAVSPAKRKVLCCGRRAGKTFVVAVKLLTTAKRTGRPCLYLTLTRENAKQIIWGDLLAMNETFALGFVPNHADLSLTHPNGGGIHLHGADSIKAIEKVRGKKYALVVLDEMQSFHDRILVPLIEQGLGPTLIDYDGEFWKVGTPNQVHRGYWWECYDGRMAASAEQHSWTLLDNAELPVVAEGKKTARQVLDDVLAEYGWTADNPTYQVEYLGNRSIETTEGLLYPHGEHNYFEALPESPAWTYVIGVDFGGQDRNAISVLGWPKYGKVVYQVDELVMPPRSDVTALGEALKPMWLRWKPVRTVADHDVQNQDELRNRWGVPVENADKNGKSGHIRLFQAALNRGEFQVRKDSAWADDAKQLRLDLDQLARGKLAEDRRGFHSDVCDAALYAWMEARAYLEKDAPPPPPTAEERERQDIEKLVREKPKPWLEREVPRGNARRVVRW